MPKKDKKLFSGELIKILSKATDNKIYGSVEIFFEAGSITQITQRIINKLTKPNKQFVIPAKKPTLKIKVKAQALPQTRKTTKEDLPAVTRTP